MKTAKEYIKEVNNFCDFNIEFDTIIGIYRFNSVSVDETYIDNFETETTSIKYSLLTFLNTIEKKVAFLNAVCGVLKINLDWYYDNKIASISNFDAIDKLTVNVIGKNHNYTPKYSIDFIRDYNDMLDDKSEELLTYLVVNKSTTQNYKNELEFEKVKLHFILAKHFQCIKNLYEYLTSIADDINNFGAMDFNPTEVIDNSIRCNIDLGKFEIAYLFRILFDYGLFYFDRNDKVKNEKLIRQFINKNFRYTSREKKLIDIRSIEKEFTMINQTNYEETVKKINKVLTVLETITKSQNSWLENNSRRNT